MSFYRIHEANEKETNYIKAVFKRITDLSETNQKIVCDAYNTVLKESGFETLEEIRFSKHSEHYTLVDHINEVCELVLMLAEKACDLWKDSFTSDVDKEQLLLLALVHDLDKVMLLSERCEKEGLNQKISHGYLSALILNDLGVPERIVSLVAYHSPSACMHLYDPLAMILHYADLFSADHLYMLVGRKPFYFG